MNAGRVEASFAEKSISGKNRDLFTFKARVMDHWKNKPEVMEQFGKKSDEFFARFLKFAENEELETVGVTMITNFAEFMIKQKKEGTLNGLGAGMLTSAIKAGAVRVLSGKYRDAQGRRIILTKPANGDNVREDLKAKIWLYFFLKLSSYDDTVDPGFTIAHDLGDASVMSLMGDAQTQQRVFQDNTFPVNLKKILLMNYGSSWSAMGFFVSSFSQFAPMTAEVVTLGYLSNKGPLYSQLPKASLPAGEPYNGEVSEEDVTASMMLPGLGIFFEPEMDPKENTASA
jgi:hypothetical protein